MSDIDEKCKLIIKLGQHKKISDLQVILDTLNPDEVYLREIYLLTNVNSNVTYFQLINICVKKLRDGDINVLFNFMMQGFSESAESKEKRFKVVMAIFRCLIEVDLSTKETVGLITRLFVDLGTFSSSDLVELIELCLEMIRKIDSKTLCWKDLLPQLVLLVNGIPKIEVNNIEMSGPEYRSVVVKNICLMRWQVNILTPIASMFKYGLIEIIKIVLNYFLLGKR